MMTERLIFTPCLEPILFEPQNNPLRKALTPMTDQEVGQDQEINTDTHCLVAAIKIPELEFKPKPACLQGRT